MLAYFYKDAFFGIWQDQETEKDWALRTIKALGHKKEDVIVIKFPSQPNSQSYYFDAEKKLVTVNKMTEEINGEMVEVNQPNTPEAGEIIFNGV